MSEFVRVRYPRARNVEIDNTITGTTNQVLLVEQGSHRFDLGQPVNYMPPFIDQVITGSTPAAPIEIIFTPLPVPPPAPPAAKAKAKKK
jgi:hypothetical protein